MPEGKIYGYARVSTKGQNLTRQVTNILRAYSISKDSVYSEKYTGTTSERPIWKKLLAQVKSGDSIIFDSVSRMSRSAEDGFNDYMQLYDKGIKLVFLKEPHLDSESYRKSAEQISMMRVGEVKSGTDSVDQLLEHIMAAVREFMALRLKEEIKLGFEQSEKEVTDLHQRTSEGLRQAKLNGSNVGGCRIQGPQKQKFDAVASTIRQYSKSFAGTLPDNAVARLLSDKITKPTYYKYKKILLKEDS